MGLKINLVYDAQASAAPQSFRDAMQTAADQLQFVIYDNITINIGVGYGEFNGAALPGAVAEGGPAYGKYEAYSTLRAQLAASETSPTDVTAVNSLPSGNSINGISTISVTSAQEKALGLIAPADSRIDGYIGVPSTWPVNSLVAAGFMKLRMPWAACPAPPKWLCTASAVPEPAYLTMASQRLRPTFQSMVGKQNLPISG